MAQEPVLAASPMPLAEPDVSRTNRQRQLIASAALIAAREVAMNSQQSRWPMYRHVERRASRLADMITHLDVDPVKLVRQRSGEAYAEARTNCLHCSNSHACLYWLEAGGAQSGLKSGPPEFCPNIELFLSCRRDAN